MTSLPGAWITRAQTAAERAAHRELYGAPCSAAAYPYWLVRDRLRWGAVGRYLALSRRIPGWTRDAEAVALALTSLNLPDESVIVENGCFLGCSTVLLAGARKLCGSGTVHVVDPFDASGEAFSAPVYKAIEGSMRRTLREVFEANIRRAGVEAWVKIHQGFGHHVAATWTEPIDLLFLDGDQSREGVRATFSAWRTALKVGGLIAVHNSAPGEYHEGHDGSLRLVEDVLRPPDYCVLRLAGMTTFVLRVR